MDLDQKQIDFLMAEVEHTVSQRAEMWKSYIYFLKSYFATLMLPFPIGAALFKFVSDSAVTSTLISTDYIYFVSLFIAILSYIFLYIVIHMRIDVLLFSRSLNGLRGFLSDGIGLELDANITLLPNTSDVPHYYEISKVMGIIVNIGCLTSGFYLNIFLVHYFEFNNPILAIAITSIIILLITNIAYYRICKYRPHVTGAEEYYLAPTYKLEEEIKSREYYGT